MAKGVINLQKESGGVTKITSTDGVGDTEVVLPESGVVTSVDGSVTDNAIARYDRTTGKLQDSGVTIDDNSVLGIGAYYGSWQSGRKVLTVGDGAVSCSPSGQQIIVSSNLRYDGTYKFITNGNMGIYAQSAGYHIWSNSLNGVAGETTNPIEHLRLDLSGNLLLTSGTGALGYGTGAGGTVTQLTSKSTAVTLNKPSGRVIMHNAALAAGESVVFVIVNSLMLNYHTASVGLIGGVSNIRNYRVEIISTNGGITLRVTNISSGSLSEGIILHFNIMIGSLS